MNRPRGTVIAAVALSAFTIVGAAMASDGAGGSGATVVEAGAAPTKRWSPVPKVPTIVRPGRPGRHEVRLRPVNQSGQSGTATIEAAAAVGTTRVEVDHPPHAAEVIGPSVQIHVGTCASAPSETIQLNGLARGASDTVIPTDLQALLNGKFSIRVSKSASEPNTYVSCGEIVAG